MDDANKPAPESEGILATAAKAVGKVAGKAAKLAHVATPAEEKAPPPPPKAKKAAGPTAPHAAAAGADAKKEGLYKAESLGNGTFLISKPKRKSAKTRQSRLKGTVRGARK